MRIIMLGHTGVGKTTYMASLYGSMQQSIEGFRLKASELEDHRRWVDVAEQIQQGKYPALTDQRQEYNFYLRYQGKNILNFAWADYRGGAIRETKESEQAKALLQDLKTADGIMLFCDCNALAQGDSRSNQIGRMTTLVSQALRELDRPMCLAIVLTKTDLVGDFQVDLLQSFNGLISAINASDFVLGALLPIACGNQLCNVPMPLLFVLHATVAFQAATIYAGVESHAERAKSYEAQSRGFVGVADWVISKISNQETYREMVAKEKRKVVEKQREFEKIIEPAMSLYNYVQKLPLIKPDFDLYDYARLLSEIQGGVIENSVSNSDIWII
ncbi:TRAFAC clade GTPase domain-containing protein [Calothrix sp. PCC 6303]|uniref:TRAFAC clade GTPase domain-containing protein n=1 Tax=Calothrix sp. PCC 6303 TaxID=1170562 RepID=UPI0002A02D91|nr:hypothetical protein [Calothrix sp. PCC 6303]AFZ04563.1 hypothetical protein Cal6303_5692 [Calothrix sp. PCC 6303]